MQAGRGGSGRIEHPGASRDFSVLGEADIAAGSSGFGRGVRSHGRGRSSRRPRSSEEGRLTMVRRGLSTVAVLAFLLSWASGNVRADLDLLGNLNATGYNTNGGVSTGQGTNYAVEFTATASDTVNSVQVVLTVQAGVLPTVGIYNATGGAMGSLVGSFTDSSLTPGTAVTETFTGSATLTSGSNYFLVLDSTNDGYYQPGSVCVVRGLQRHEPQRPDAHVPGLRCDIRRCRREWVVFRIQCDAELPAQWRRRTVHACSRPRAILDGPRRTRRRAAPDGRLVAVATKRQSIGRLTPRVGGVRSPDGGLIASRDRPRPSVGSGCRRPIRARARPSGPRRWRRRRGPARAARGAAGRRTRARRRGS